MKTKSPREILLERHAAAEPELDAIRQAVLRAREARPAPWWRLAWAEIVLAARPAWMGLGTLAVVAALLDGLAYEPAGSKSRTLTRWRVEPAMIREERSRLTVDPLEARHAPETPLEPSADALHENGLRRSDIPVRLWPV